MTDPNNQTFSFSAAGIADLTIDTEGNILTPLTEQDTAYWAENFTRFLQGVSDKLAELNLTKANLSPTLQPIVSLLVVFEVASIIDEASAAESTEDAFKILASGVANIFVANYGNYISAASVGLYFRPVFTIALRIVRSFLAAAQIACFGVFPLASRRWRNALKPASHLQACRAAM